MASIVSRLSHYDSAAALLLRAPFDHEQWIPALSATAGATGSASASLLGILSSGETQFALSPIRPQAAMPDLIGDWVAHGGNDPKRNPLAARALRTPVLQEFSDADVISGEERRRHPLWKEFYNTHGLPHFGVCSIWRKADSHIMLTLSRTKTQGAIHEAERSTFRRLARHWRDAAMFIRALKVEGVRVLTGALDRLSIAALVLDGFGRVVAMTAPAHEIARTGKFVHLRNGRIEAVLADQESCLRRAGHCCVGSMREKGRTAVLRLRGLQGAEITVRVWPLPHQNDLAFGAAALMVFETHQPPALSDFGFTAAEIEIASAVLAGKRVRDIARCRGATYETVRSQIKSIYSKAGVRSRAEFSARRKD